jgi:uncharacterized protein with WD repeat
LAVSGGIFISYRRQETSEVAGLLYDRLVDHFGDDQVFMDIDAIEPGVDFAEVITQAVARCQALLAVIGPQWLTATDQAGRRRLDDPDDSVHLEVQAALRRDVPVIPILVEDAAMPRRQELPESLARLARCSALTVRHHHPAFHHLAFRYDVQRLVTALEGILHATAPAAGASASRVKQPPAAASPLDALSGAKAIQKFVHAGDVLGLAFSPDGRLLVTGSNDHTARLWEVASGQERTRLTHDSAVWAVAFSPDGRLLASGSGNGIVRVWDTASGELVRELSSTERQVRWVFAVAFSPDGRQLASGSNGPVQVWDTASGELVRELLSRPRERWGVWGIAFSPDGRLLATGSGDWTTRLWDVASWQKRAEFTHRSALFDVAFSPDGRLMATGSMDGTARLWEVASGLERARLTHDSAVMSVAFSPDGRLLVTGSNDHTARLWEVASGQERTRLTRLDWVSSVAFSPDGRLLAIGSGDMTARLWALLG